jgi:hypothetical protein
MALGAQRAQVLALVLRSDAMLTGLGLALGMGQRDRRHAGAARHAVRRHAVRRGTFVTVSLLFGLVAMVASYIPARLATKGDPMSVLHTEG